MSWHTAKQAWKKLYGSEPTAADLETLTVVVEVTKQMVNEHVVKHVVVESATTANFSGMWILTQDCLVCKKIAEHNSGLIPEQDHYTGDGQRQQYEPESA